MLGSPPVPLRGPWSGRKPHKWRGVREEARPRADARRRRRQEVSVVIKPDVRPPGRWCSGQGQKVQGKGEHKQTNSKFKYIGVANRYQMIQASLYWPD